MACLAINGGKKTVTERAPLWPKIGEEEIEEVVKALRKSSEDIRYLTAASGGGPMEDFEQAFAKYLGRKYAVSTNGGTAALHIAVMAAGVEAGDEVIVSPYTWGQTAGCILHQNAIPVYADIDPQTYNLKPQSIEEKITPATKAIMVVHLYGHPADMDSIMEVARKHNLKVIEDCAQANGAEYKGKKVGTLGDIGCFSIGDGKNMIGGEGGVIVVDDEDLFEKIILRGRHPMRMEPTLKNPAHRKWIDSMGYNYRIHPLAAVIAKVQLKYLDSWNEERRRNAHYFSKHLLPIPGIVPVYEAPYAKHVYHQYSPTYVPEDLGGLPKEKYIEALRAEGVPIFAYIGLPIYLRPMHQEHYFFHGKGCPWTCQFASREVIYKKGDCPVAEERCEKGELNIGSTGWLGDGSEFLDQYLEAFKKIADNLNELR